MKNVNKVLFSQVDVTSEFLNLMIFILFQFNEYFDDVKIDFCFPLYHFNLILEQPTVDVLGV